MLTRVRADASLKPPDTHRGAQMYDTSGANLAHVPGKQIA